MDVDDRVKALEEEVLILKNQIQATLLEIQELMLKQTHPSLQMVEAPKEAQAAPAVTPVVLVQDERTTNAPLKLVSPSPAQQPQAPQAQSSAPTAPLNRARAAQAQRQAAQAAQPQSNLPNWANPEKLEKWTREKIAKLGTARTRDLINLYADDGRYERSIQEHLLALVDAYEKQSMPPARNTGEQRRTAPMPPTQAQSAPRRHPVEPPESQDLSGAATFTEATRRAADENHYPSKNSLPIKYAVMPPGNPLQTLSGTTGKPVPPPPAKPQAHADATDVSRERLILKLIAGVQNAGIVSKRGNRGQSH